MSELYIKCICFVGQTRKDRRMLKVNLSNGALVKIVPCYEGWQQYNATVDEKRVTIGLAESFNGWLHGENFPLWGKA
jgi:hypothetical protein